MALMRRSSYQQRLFLLVLTFALVLTTCFVAYQHSRERLYKAERLDARLQRLNQRIADKWEAGEAPDSLFRRYQGSFEGLRLTLMDTLGVVFYDSEAVGSEHTMPNHRTRNEVAEALQNGTGSTLHRRSEATPKAYFYSALADEGIVVRTALPYDWSLSQTLGVDLRFLWYMGLVTLLLIVVGYFITSRLSENILRLRWFTEMLDRGEDVSDIEPFPNDELGEISNHIVTLYARLQHALSEAEREHAAALHEEQEKIRIKRQLTNNINHELKTPVSAIRGYLESILQNPTMEESLKRSFLEKSLTQTERLQQLLQDVSMVTRTDEAPHLIEREALDLRPLIDDILNEIPERGGQPMLLRIDLPDTLPLYGNPTLLHSIFHNLVDNATAYSGGSEIEIRLQDENAESYRFYVADNGSGVGEEHLDRLFERFYRIDKGRSRKLGGTGLGLSIVKNAVIFHGGQIEARNRTEGGLEFLFTLRKHA